MRTPFNLSGDQEMIFTHEGKTYSYAGARHLAQKPNFAANIEETILQTEDGKLIWLTVVGAGDDPGPYGIKSGWYVTQTLDKDSAVNLTKAFSLWASR
jgi:hypothetical protein